MESGKRQHLQDIYATDQTAKDDFTPQVSKEMQQERMRDIRRHQFQGFFMGAVILAVAIGVVTVVVKKYLDDLNEAKAPEAITQEYIPRYSLPAESQWVLDLDRSFSDPQWDGEGERPINPFWIKKMAFNVIRAEQAAGIKEFGEAAKYYENVLEIMPDIEGVKIPLGLVYFELEQFEKALALLEGTSNDDLTPDILNNLAAACMDAKAYDQAEEYLNKALAEEPDYTQALRNQAILYQKMDKETEAIKAYEVYLDHRSDDDDTRYSFALYLTKIGNWELASEQLRILTEEITDEANLYRLQAQVEAKLGNNAGALEALKRATALTDPNLTLGWMNEKEFDNLRKDEDFQAHMKYLNDR